MVGGMTVRKKDTDDPALRRVGAIIKRHRRELLDIKPSRQDFISEAECSGLRVGWISEKSLANIENGYNFPSLPTLYNLAIACQISPADLFGEVAGAGYAAPPIPRHRSMRCSANGQFW